MFTMSTISKFKLATIGCIGSAVLSVVLNDPPWAVITILIGGYCMLWILDAYEGYTPATKTTPGVKPSPKIAELEKSTARMSAQRDQLWSSMDAMVGDMIDSDLDWDTLVEVLESPQTRTACIEVVAAELMFRRNRGAMIMLQTGTDLS